MSELEELNKDVEEVKELSKVQLSKDNRELLSNIKESIIALAKKNGVSSSELLEGLQSINETIKGKRVNIPKTFDVNVLNQKDIPDTVKVSNFPKINIPDKVKIESIEEQEWMTSRLEAIVEAVIGLIKQNNLNKINLSDYEKAGRPLAVRLSTGQKFYDAMLAVTQSASKTPFKLVSEVHDYISVAYPSNTIEIYTFKINGVNGNTVATVTVEYTDSTKENISVVTKS